jgi:ferredoxin-NADP reductase
MPRRLRCQVLEIVDHGERVYSVFLKPESTAPRFQAGQFLHLALNPYRPGDFWPESRVFSIASPPSARDLLRITYAVKGVFTSRMEAELSPGGEVWVKLPYGEFSVTGDSDACLLAGGTGITAFTAFLGGLPAGYAPRVDLFYGARIPPLLIYRPLIEEAARRCPNLQVHYLAERNDDGADCLTGRVEPGTIWPLIRDPRAMTFYLSGPPEMLSSVRRGLTERGVAPGRIVVDAWE